MKKRYMAISLLLMFVFGFIVSAQIVPRPVPDSGQRINYTISPVEKWNGTWNGRNAEGVELKLLSQKIKGRYDADRDMYIFSGIRFNYTDYTGTYPYRRTFKTRGYDGNYRKAYLELNSKINKTIYCSARPLDDGCGKFEPVVVPNIQRFNLTIDVVG